MAHDVFISHSSKDKVMADAICAGLEARSIRCWIAPRDIEPGQNYAGQLYKAIEKCKVFLVVLTGNSLLSTHILKEVELAVQSGNAILPFRVQDVPLTDDLKYYLGNVHWLDALTPPVEKHIGILAEFIKRILDAQVAKAGFSVEEQGKPALSIKPVEISPTPTSPVRKKKTKNIVLLASLGLLIVGFVVGAVTLGNKLAGKTEFQTSMDQGTTNTPFLSTLTKTALSPTLSPTSTLKPSATPGNSTAELLKNANCYETAREDSPNVETLLRGAKFVVLGQSNDGTWMNLKYDGGKHFHHDQYLIVKDCWIYKSNLEILGQVILLPVFTPRPASHQEWEATASGTRPDGSTFGGRFRNSDKSVAILQAENFCREQIGYGNTCTYEIHIYFTW